MKQDSTEISAELTGKELKVIFTSINPIASLIEPLKNLEIQAEWIPLVKSGEAEEDSFTFSTLKSTFDAAQEQEADLVIAVDSDSNFFSIGVRKFANSNFLLLNIHQLTVLLSNILLENHSEFDLYRSLLITSAADKLFEKRNLGIRILSEIKSPIAEIPEYDKIPDGSLIISDQQELELKGQRDSMSYLLSRIIDEAKKEANRDRTLFEKLIEIYQTIGYQREKLLSVSTEGTNQKQFFKKIFEKFRKKPPVNLGFADLIAVEDLQNGSLKNLLSGRIVASRLPYTQGLQVYLTNQIRFLMLPKGDKVFFFFTSEGRTVSAEEIGKINQAYDQQVVKLLSEINRLGLMN